MRTLFVITVILCIKSASLLAQDVTQGPDPKLAPESGAELSIENENLAADFVLKSNNGNNVRLSEYRGTVILLNFWGSWCGSCRLEMAFLNELYGEFSPSEFLVLGISLDDDVQRAQGVAQQLGLRYPTLYDWDRQIASYYEINDVPASILIDRDGVRHLDLPVFTPEKAPYYRAEIERLVKE